MHMSFNIMTLGGMAAAVGLITDDTVVMVEHIIRRLRAESGRSPRQGDACRSRVHPAARRVIRLHHHHLCTAGIPVRGDRSVFQGPVADPGPSLFVSFLVAWLAVPLLADRLLSRKDAAQKEGEL